MLQLNLPDYNFRIKKTEKKTLIFDEFRKKWIVLTPEEWVRQNFVKFLSDKLQYPVNNIALERKLNINGTLKRFDALVFNKTAQPVVIIEFKAPDVEISQKTFDQAAIYNYLLRTPYLFISNGMNHYFCKIDYEAGRYIFLEKVPFYSELL